LEKNVCCLVFRLWVDVVDSSRSEDLLALVLGRGFVGRTNSQRRGDYRRRIILAGIESPGGLLPGLDYRRNGSLAAADIKVLDLAALRALGGAPQTRLRVVRLLDGVVGGLLVGSCGRFFINVNRGSHSLVDDDGGLMVGLGGRHVHWGGGLVAWLGSAVRLFLLRWRLWLSWLVGGLCRSIVRGLGRRLVSRLGWGSRSLVRWLSWSLVSGLSGSLWSVVLRRGLWCRGLGCLVSWLRRWWWFVRWLWGCWWLVSWWGLSCLVRWPHWLLSDRLRVSMVVVFWGSILLLWLG